MEDIYEGRDPRDIPNHAVAEAAHLLRLPPSTVRAWTRGRWCRTRSERRFFEPVIDLPDRERSQLSFTNLVELHVLSAIRREHRVTLPKVRQALDYVAQAFPTPHPLARVEFQTDGVDLFVERFGPLVSASRRGQIAMRDIMETYLERIERDEAGLAAKLCPFTRAAGEPQPRTILIDPRISFGRPVLAGSGIPTSVVAERYTAGDSIEELARDYERDEKEIEEAIRVELLMAA